MMILDLYLVVLFPFDSLNTRTQEVPRIKYIQVLYYTIPTSIIVTMFLPLTQRDDALFITAVWQTPEVPLVPMSLMIGLPKHTKRGWLHKDSLVFILDAMFLWKQKCCLHNHQRVKRGSGSVPLSNLNLSTSSSFSLIQMNKTFAISFNPRGIKNIDLGYINLDLKR